MKRLIITTIILIITSVLVTILYFGNLGTTGLHRGRVMNTIPNDAALIFEFNNEKGFYEIFSGSKLLSSIAGKQKLDELNSLRTQLLLNPLLEQYFTEQNIFISLHAQTGNSFDFLLTTSASQGFKTELIDQLIKQPQKGMVINNIILAGKQGYTIYLNNLKKRFYLVNKEDNTFSGSFSKDLIEKCIKYSGKRDEQAFVLLPDQQHTNSLATLYINYHQLSPLFQQLFINSDPEIFKSFRMLPALAALSLNYKSNALMFNGFSNIQHTQPTSYLQLFMDQHPVINRIKDIFPATTAYSLNFAISDPIKFEKNLSDWQIKVGATTEKAKLLRKVKAETGIDLKSEFNRLLGTEFAIITTRYREKIAIIQIKDGSKLTPVLQNISTSINQGEGQFNYEKLPYFLFGDPFNQFKKPYFKIIDNYLILTESESEMTSYNDTYINRKFLNKTDEYNNFNDLLTERYNVGFIILFKNARVLLKRDMKPLFYPFSDIQNLGWNNFYAASYQFTASDNNYYTNFCMGLSKDTMSKKK